MTARVQTFAPNGRSGHVTGAHPRFNPREKASPLTPSFHRTSFRRYEYRERQKKHTICQPSRVLSAITRGSCFWGGQSNAGSKVTSNLESTRSF